MRVSKVRKVSTVGTVSLADKGKIPDSLCVFNLVKLVKSEKCQKVVVSKVSTNSPELQ